MARTLFGTSFCLALVCLFVGSSALSAQTAPNTPTITEPAIDNQVVNAADVHMETAPYFDSDGDAHLCTTWEIRTVIGDELAWTGVCVTGPESIHAHFGDGNFVNAHAGRTELFPGTDYVLRVRHRDDSGDPASEWSVFQTRPFTTAAATQLFPLELDDIETVPQPTWVDESGLPMVLPAATTPPEVIIEQTTGAALWTFRGFDGLTNELIDAPLLPDHDAVRLRIAAGSVANLALPPSDLTFVDHEGDTHTVYLPSLAVASGQSAIYWITENGATYEGVVGSNTPDFSTLARGIPVPWITHEPGYEVEIVASGFRLPVNIAFVPAPGSGPSDVLYYVSELYGSIRAVTNDGTVSDYATNLLNFTRTGNFPGSGEQGVTGIAVDPTNGDVVASMLYDAGGPHYPRVVRFSSVDGGLTASTMTTLLDMPGETQGQSHQISSVSFGPDGMLYIHNGDGFDASTGQNLNSYRGKVLRIHPDGSVPTDNPFYNAGNGINATDHVYAYGLRNPFGGAWRAADGMRYIVENGPSIDRYTQLVSGRNYLWNGSNSSMTNFALHTWSPATGPVNISFIEPETFGGSGFPAAFQGHSFVAESGPTWATGPQTRGKKIRRYVLDGAGNLASGPHDFVEYVGTGKATVIALASGPDGLYFSDFYKDLNFTGPTDSGANILRVRYVGFADFTANNTTGPGPLNVQFFDASDVPGATDWAWDFGDGNTGSGPNPTHTYTQDGFYNVRLTVTGSAGVQIAEKGNFVRVGDIQLVAYIGGSLPATASDQAAADHLTAAGYDVTLFDDEPANRPSAAALAAGYDAVVVSSTTLSSNIAGEFRTADVPLIFWESAMIASDREPMADAGTVIGGQTTINVVDNSHPVTSGLALGLLTISSSASFSLGQAPFGPDVDVLATQAGNSDNAAIMVSEAGASLLSGYVPVARRVYLPYEDSTFSAANGVGEELLVRALNWVTSPPAGSFRRADCTTDGMIDLSDPIALLLHLFAGGATPGCSDACDFDDDGTLTIGDAIGALDYLFVGGAPPPAPGLNCGTDPSSDALDCSGGGGC